MRDGIAKDRGATSKEAAHQADRNRGTPSCLYSDGVNGCRNWMDGWMGGMDMKISAFLTRCTIHCSYQEDLSYLIVLWVSQPLAAQRDVITWIVNSQ